MSDTVRATTDAAQTVRKATRKQAAKVGALPSLRTLYGIVVKHVDGDTPNVLTVADIAGLMLGRGAGKADIAALGKRLRKDFRSADKAVGFGNDGKYTRWQFDADAAETVKLVKVLRERYKSS